MRRVPLVVGIVLSLASAAAAQEPHHSVQAFGGLQLGTIGSTDSTFGGVLTAHLTPNLQVVGEGGRISNVLPSPFEALIGFSPIGFSVSAWYMQGGLRLTTADASGMRPYAEASAGFARIHSSIGDLGDPVVNALADFGLRFLDSTDPVASVGGGVTFEGGAFIVDAGYRYRRIFSSDWINALSFGGTLHTNEVRVGVGVRF